jgi:hypothetical protein
MNTRTEYDKLNDNLPYYSHDCDKCRFLGKTLGGRHIVDCYVCNEAHAKQHNRAPTLIARYGEEGHEYCSSPFNYIGPRGHSELWAAKGLFLLTFAGEPWWDQEDAA